MNQKSIPFISFLFLIVFSQVQAADDVWPASVPAVHKQLTHYSPFYQHMVRSINTRHDLEFRKEGSVTLGTVVDTGQKLQIQVNPSLANERLVSVSIWEIANAFQRETFDVIGRRVRTGEIKTAREYGLRMELVEYSSFRFHKKVLEELSGHLGDLDGEYLFFINPDLNRLSDYNLPYVHDYIDAQARSGHTAHYEKWFWKIRGATSP